uniref:Endoplasmic reticulum junction formation protein lunapark n=1 Tax=Panstrongylus lignarius TaxID=156445 RepID=A0A224XLN1_9HEMI
MGIILSRYRKKKNAEELLEDIEKEIDDIESNKQYAVQREKYIVWRLILYSSLVYITTAVLFYVYFFPASLRDQMFYMIPLLIFPVIILFVKRCITWIYTRKISKNKTRLIQLKARKKQILDDVMNTETYKIAKQILDKYAPEQVKKPTMPAPSNMNRGITGTPAGKPLVGVGSVALLTSSGPQPRMRVNTPIGPNVSPIGPCSPIYQQRKLIRPILSRDRTYIDRLIDVILGDGPNNRYALICKNCSCHNGMALKEEFEYLAFRCVYCGFPNPSLKPRIKRPLQLDYTTEAHGDSAHIKALTDLNLSTESSQSGEENDESGGVIITEVSDSSQTEITEGITQRKSTSTSDAEEVKDSTSTTTATITEEIDIKEVENVEETKKTQ